MFLIPKDKPVKWFLLSLAISLSQISIAKTTCEISYTPIPPFYMINVKQGYGHTEIVKADEGNIVVGNEDSFLAESTFEKERKLLLQGDILVSNKTFDERWKEYINLEKLRRLNQNQKINLQVLHHNKALSVRKDFAKNGYQYASNGEHMSVDSRHIQTSFPVNQKFRLNNTSKLKMIAENNGRSFLKDHYIQMGTNLKFVNGKSNEYKDSFKIIKCKNDQTRQTIVKYLVQKVDDNGNVIGNELAIDSTQCGGLDATLQVIPEDSFKDYVRLSKMAQKLEFDAGDIYWTPKNLAINSYGYASVPLQYNLNGPYNLGPKSLNSKGHDFVHRNARYHNTKLEKTGSDTWGKPASICSFTEMARRWKNKCMQMNNNDLLPKNGKRYIQCTIQLNEIAFYNPFKRKNSRNIDPLGHANHSDGRCFDIRPFRKDDQLLNSHSNDPKNSSSMNFQFLKFISQFGAKEILYNDWKIRRDYASELKRLPNIRVNASGHENHFHFCLPENPTLKNNTKQCWAD